jgi:CubicO group peptidase (beta-lactamase class C family)
MIKKRHFTLVVLFLIASINFNYTPTVNGDVSEIELLKSVGLRITLEEQLNAIDSILTRDVKRYKFHGNVLIGYKDEIIYKKAFGYANPISKTKLKTEDQFELASVSKQFTAAAVLRLMEMNLINVEAPLADYFPNFRHKNVTVRHLLKHTSGLYDYMHLTERYWEKAEGPNSMEIVGLINKYEKYLNTAAGTTYKYCNTGYVLLAALIEQVSGKTYDQFLNDEIFIPSGMYNTFVNLDDSKNEALLNGYIPYHRTYLPKVKSLHNSTKGDKGVYSTSTDLFKWMTALKNEQIISNSSLDMMFNADLELEHKSRYGMGFRTMSRPQDQTRIYHNGLWDGFRTGIAYYPKSDFVVVVLNHTQCRGKGIIQRKIEKMALAMLTEEIKAADLRN